MSVKLTIAALATGALITWGWAQAAPEAPEASQEVPVIILEVQPQAPGTAAGEVDQAIMTMLLMQLLMGLQAEGENADMAPVAAPIAGTQRI